MDVEAKVVLFVYEGHQHLRYSLAACFGGLSNSLVASGSEGGEGL